MFLISGLFLSAALYKDADTETPPSHEQMRTRPQIEDVICQSLEGSKLKEALFIIDNIRENNMKIKWSSVNVWTVQYKRKHVCDLRIEKGNLIIGKLSDILITRVKDLSYNPRSANPLLDAIIDMVNGEQKAYAIQ